MGRCCCRRGPATRTTTTTAAAAGRCRQRGACWRPVAGPLLLLLLPLLVPVRPPPRLAPSLRGRRASLFSVFVFVFGVGSRRARASACWRRRWRRQTTTAGGRINWRWAFVRRWPCSRDRTCLRVLDRMLRQQDRQGASGARAAIAGTRSCLRSSPHSLGDAKWGAVERRTRRWHGRRDPSSRGRGEKDTHPPFSLFLSGKACSVTRLLARLAELIKASSD